MLKRTKIRIGIGSAAAVALVAGALTTAYASPWGHGSSSSSYSSSSSSWNPNIVTSTTTIKDVSSTVTSGGDTKPHGVAVVPRSIGNLVRGDVLVTNSSSKTSWGAGSTIVEINPNTGKQTLFSWLTPKNLPSTCPGGIGLNSTIVVLRDGWVIVGSSPTTSSGYKNASAGCLIVLNSLGHAKAVIAGGWLNGPGGLTVVDNGNNVQLFVTSVLNGTSGHWGRVMNTATVIRINLSVTQQTIRIRTIVIIATGLPTRVSTTGLITAPTSLVIVGNTLFIVDTINSRIIVINFATTRNFIAVIFVLTRGGLLNSPVAITLFNNVLLVTNGGNGNLIAISLTGRTALVKALDTTAVSGSSPGAGALWGITPSLDGKWIYYADSMENTLSACGPLSS